MLSCNCEIGGVYSQVYGRSECVLEPYRVFETQEAAAHDPVEFVSVDSRPLKAVATDANVAEYPDRSGWMSDTDVEMDILYRAFGELLPLWNRVIFHGVAIAFGGSGYVFTARSGTGKSTHAFLWQRYLGRYVSILSGDKPIISASQGCEQNEIPLVWGSPWGGKERLFESASVPLKGICQLVRGTRCSIVKVSPAEFLEVALSQTYVPRKDPAASRSLDVIDQVLRTVPLYRLYCDISEDAVRTSFEAMTGLDYDAHRVCQKM